MDKTEYQLKLSELTECVKKRRYEAALKIVEEIDWKRVKSIRTLSMVADIYEVNRDYRNCKKILLMAYEKTSIGKNILFRLTEVSLKTKELTDAENYYKQYMEVAPDDNARYLLQYRLYKAKKMPPAEQIRVLEEYKEHEYTERWAYELAELYYRAGMKEKCIAACDDMILWFNEGKYVLKALELKQKFETLAPYQQKIYDKVQNTTAETEKPNIILPVATKDTAKADFRRAEQVDSRSILEKMDQAGAAITKNVAVDDRERAMPLTDDAVDRYSITSREFMGKTANLSVQLEKSIQTVFTAQGHEPGDTQTELQQNLQAAEESVQSAPEAAEVGMQESEAQAQPVQEAKKPLYNLELEIPDPEPTEEEKKSHTMTLSKLGQNTVPISIEDVLRQETPEERRIRILNDAKPTRMNDDQRKIFTYFARIPGMDHQILEALSGVYKYAGERTSRCGNIAVMGAKGTGKTRLTRGLLLNMCKDMGLDAAKVARVKGYTLNHRNIAEVVAKMAGGFLIIEDAGEMKQETIDALNQAMEFRTDCMIVILEAEKSSMRALLKDHPEFAEKFNTVISIPVFTNDELVTFARTYCTENNCQMDEMGVLALYTLISNNQSEDQPMTIADVKSMVDNAIYRAKKGGKRFGRGRKGKEKVTMLYEKDFDVV